MNIFKVRHKVVGVCMINEEHICDGIKISESERKYIIDFTSFS